jgi:putative phosphoesterase
VHREIKKDPATAKVTRLSEVGRSMWDRVSRTCRSARIDECCSAADWNRLGHPRAPAAEAEQGLAGVAHIIHAGDIGRADVLVRLRRIAPVTAIRGNIDTADWAKHYPDTQAVQLGGRSFYVLHDLQELQIDPAVCGIDVVVSGHSHRPRIQTIDDVLYLNPGSAGPRRFKLPVTLATLEITSSVLRPVIHDLSRTE